MTFYIEISWRIDQKNLTWNGQVWAAHFYPPNTRRNAVIFSTAYQPHFRCLCTGNSCHPEQLFSLLPIFLQHVDDQMVSWSLHTDYIWDGGTRHHTIYTIVPMNRTKSHNVHVIVFGHHKLNQIGSKISSSLHLSSFWWWWLSYGTSGLDSLNRNSSISPFNEQLMDRNPHWSHTVFQPNFDRHGSESSDPQMVQSNNVLLVKIEGPVWYTIYHHLPVVFQGFLQTPLLINQPMGKGHLWFKVDTLRSYLWLIGLFFGTTFLVAIFTLRDLCWFWRVQIWSILDCCSFKSLSLLHEISLAAQYFPYFCSLNLNFCWSSIGFAVEVLDYIG